MKKVVIFLNLFLIPLGLSAASLGGRLEITALGTIDSKDEISNGFWKSGRIEFLLPSDKNHSGRFELDFFETNGESDIFIRSLYLRKKFEKFHFTLGKQPVSWAFGSLLNPAEYTLGAEIATSERRGKFLSGAEIYVPLGWSGGVSLVATQIPDSDEMKTGLRIRGGLKGYDLAIGFVNEPGALSLLDGKTRNRLVFSLKGDLGPLGIYAGGSGIWKKNDYATGETAYLVGGDISFEIFDIYRLIIQGEYMNAPPAYLSEITGSSIDISESREEALITSLVLGLDEFTSLGLTGFYFFGADSLVLSPYLQTELGGGFMLDVRAGYMSGENIALFGKTLFEGELTPVKGILQFTLSYSF